MTDQTEAPSPSLRVRPYTVTRGRTRTEVELEIETMVQIARTGQGNGQPPPNPAEGLVSEARAILALCSTPQSVAEISAHLKLPLQVVKVLAGDLVIAGRLATYTGATQSDGRPDLALLERVLDGLQSL
ncbi:MAG: DUF742 domain-containing protein [Acidimicrobiales bacterium]